MTKETREEYAKLHKECGDLLTLCATGKRTQTAEEKTAQEARYARMDVLKAEAEAEKRQAGYAFATGETERQTQGKSQAQLEIERQQGGVATADEDENAFTRKMTPEEIRKFKKEANHFLRTGQVRDNFTITTSGNAILVPTAVMPPEAIRRNMNAFRALLAATGYEPLQTTGTETLVLPIFDDTGVTGDTPAEGATSANTADFTTTNSVTLGATLYSSKQRWFSNTVLNANGFDMLGYVTPILQKSVDKTQESAFTTALIALAGTAPTFTNAAKAALTYQELLSWEHTLNVAYRFDAGFLLSDTLYKTIRGLVDNNNRPIMDLDPTNVFQSRIHNKPAFVSDYLNAMGTANGVAGAFISGDGIKLRDVMPQRLTRFVNVPQYPDQTGFQLFANGDCKFVNQATAILKLNAT